MHPRASITQCSSFLRLGWVARSKKPCKGAWAALAPKTIASSPMVETIMPTSETVRRWGETPVPNWVVIVNMTPSENTSRSFSSKTVLSTTEGVVFTSLA